MNQDSIDPLYALTLGLLNGDDGTVERYWEAGLSEYEPGLPPDRSPLHQVAWEGIEYMVPGLQSDGRCRVSDGDCTGRTPLHYACLGADEESLNAGKWIGTIKALLEDDECRVNQRDHDGRTALHLGVRSHEATRLLLEAGADLEARDHHGATPLARASGDGNATVVKVLLAAGAEVDPRDHEGETPLSRAVARGNAAVCEMLLDAGAGICFGAHRQGAPSLDIRHTAARHAHGDPGILRSILEQPSTPPVPQILDDAGATLLHTAAGQGDPDLCRWLCNEHGLSPKARDNKGRTPVDVIEERRTSGTLEDHVWEGLDDTAAFLRSLSARGLVRSALGGGADTGDDGRRDG
ncbi:MAG TPA: ankyrin repeat domain-containing protein [Gammaproteobacteria bacterium]|nr:ankyrin repeat domain-containing protein [Gammaproteobacteria bacterium]